VVFEIMPEEPERTSAQRPQASATYRFQMPAFVEVTIRRSGGIRKRLNSGKMIVLSADTDEQLAKNYGDNAMLVATEVMNTGNILLELSGQLIIRDEDNRLIKRCPLGAGRGAILPSTRSYLRSIIAKLRPGKYTLKAIIQYGGYSPAVTTQSVDISRSSAVVGEGGVSLPLEIELRPPYASLNIPPGAFRTFGATLINNEIFPVEIRVSKGQIYHDLEGEMWTTATADSGRSVANWLDIEPSEFVMDPLSRKAIRLSVNTPDTAAGGYYGCLLLNARAVDSIPTADDFLPSELSMPIVVETPAGIEYDGEIEDLRIDQTPSHGVTLKPTFRNTGNSHTMVRGFADIEMWTTYEPGGEEVVVLSEPKFERVGRVDIEVDSTYIFPGESRLLSSQTIEQLPAGRYRARVELSCGISPNMQTTSLEREFVIEKSEN
jgi:hypothetical protein